MDSEEVALACEGLSLCEGSSPLLSTTACPQVPEHVLQKCCSGSHVNLKLVKPCQVSSLFDHPSIRAIGEWGAWVPGIRRGDGENLGP